MSERDDCSDDGRRPARPPTVLLVLLAVLLLSCGLVVANLLAVARLH